MVGSWWFLPLTSPDLNHAAVGATCAQLKLPRDRSRTRVARNCRICLVVSAWWYGGLGPGSGGVCSHSFCSMLVAPSHSYQCPLLLKCRDICNAIMLCLCQVMACYDHRTHSILCIHTPYAHITYTRASHDKQS